MYKSARRRSFSHGISHGMTLNSKKSLISLSIEWAWGISQRIKKIGSEYSQRDMKNPQAYAPGAERQKFPICRLNTCPQANAT